MGKLVTGDSGFCIAMGVMALQKFGVGSIGQSTFPATTFMAHGDEAVGPHGDVCSRDGRTAILGALHQR